MTSTHIRAKILANGAEPGRHADPVESDDHPVGGVIGYENEPGCHADATEEHEHRAGRAAGDEAGPRRHAGPAPGDEHPALRHGHLAEADGADHPDHGEKPEEAAHARRAGGGGDRRGGVVAEIVLIPNTVGPKIIPARISPMIAGCLSLMNISTNTFAANSIIDMLNKSITILGCDDSIYRTIKIFEGKSSKICSVSIGTNLSHSVGFFIFDGIIYKSGEFLSTKLRSACFSFP